MSHTIQISITTEAEEVLTETQSYNIVGDNLVQFDLSLAVGESVSIPSINYRQGEELVFAANIPADAPDGSEVMVLFEEDIGGDWEEVVGGEAIVTKQKNFLYARNRYPRPVDANLLEPEDSQNPIRMSVSNLQGSPATRIQIAYLSQPL